MSARRNASLLALVLACALPTSARAEAAVYALSIGHNQPLAADAQLPTLRYADDDALRFHALLSRVSAHAELLTVLDAETQARKRGRSGGTRAPSLAALRRAIDAIAVRAAADVKAGREPVVFITYSGHGGTLPSGESYLTLSDAALTRELLEAELLAKLPGARVHLIVDACNAAAVIGVRGPFDREVEAERVLLSQSETATLLERDLLKRYPNVGALLASSSAQETHEWSRIQGGVFTHIVLSALLGAADINGDLAIEYSEVQAFVASAQRGLSDPRARPRLVAHAPAEDPRAVLLALGALRDTVILTGRRADLGHFFIELEDGTRWLDAHVGSDVSLSLALPRQSTSYLRTDAQEALVRAEPGERAVELAALALRARDARSKGSVEDALARDLFREPYSRAYYQGFADSQSLVQVDFDGGAQPSSLERDTGSAQRTWSIGLFVAGGVAAIASGVALGLALDAKADFDGTEVQREAAEAKSRADDMRVASAVLGGVALAAAATGTVLWLTADVDPATDSATLGLAGRF